MEIFKAKTLKGAWVTGYYVLHQKVTHCCIGPIQEPQKAHYIYYSEFSDWGLPRRLLREEINVKTLCKFTGAYLKGKRLFENDIIKLNDSVYVVKYNIEDFCWVALSVGEETPLRLKDLLNTSENCSIIDNIFNKVGE